jgi:hypothetical protein
LPTLFRTAVLLVSSLAAVACGGAPREAVSPPSFESWSPPGQELVVVVRNAPVAPTHSSAPQVMRPNHHASRSINHSPRYAP